MNFSIKIMYGKKSRFCTFFEFWFLKCGSGIEGSCDFAWVQNSNIKTWVSKFNHFLGCYHSVHSKIAKILRSIRKVWWFQDFSNTQILREINIRDSRSANSAILTQLTSLNCDFYYFFHFLKTEISQIDKIQSP